MKTSRLIVFSLVILIGFTAMLLSSPTPASSAAEFLGITLTPTTVTDPTSTPVPATPVPTTAPTSVPTIDPGSGDSDEDDDALATVVFLPPAGFGTEAQGGQPESPSIVLGSSARLIIPDLHVSSPVRGVSASGYTWDIRDLGTAVGWLAETARPSQPGNVVLVGHVYVENGAPFENLNQLEEGQEIRLVMGNTLYVYRVTGKRLVAPEDTSVLRSDARYLLTLITCANYDAQQKTYLSRLIVTAELAGRAGQTVSAK